MSLIHSTHCRALITTQHVLAVWGWHLTAGRILSEEHLNYQGLGFPQEGTTAASLASGAQTHQRRRAADGSRAGWQPAGPVTQSCLGSWSRPSGDGNVAQVRTAELSRLTSEPEVPVAEVGVGSSLSITSESFLPHLYPCRPWDYLIHSEKDQQVLLPPGSRKSCQVRTRGPQRLECFQTTIQ